MHIVRVPTTVELRVKVFILPLASTSQLQSERHLELEDASKILPCQSTIEQEFLDIRNEAVENGA